MSGKSALLRVIQGALIGLGAILPGISGGVLAIIFGIYRPAMEVLTHPKQALREHWRMFFCVGLGWLLGFAAGAGGVNALLQSSEKAATCLFIGLILGTLPAFWREAGEQGRGKCGYISLCVTAAFIAGLLWLLNSATLVTMRPNTAGFVFCGVIWGISIIVPGMNSSSILMAVGLFEPLVQGFVTFDFGVLLPWGIAMAVVILSFARLIEWLFRARHEIAYHAVFGITVATTVSIIPLQFSGAFEVLLCLLCAAVGAVGAYFSTKLQA